jgi:hypothetical protein
MNASIHSARPRVQAVLLPTVLCVALAACGGGGDAGSSTSTSAETATIHSANATSMSSDATTALDAGVVAAQSVVSAQATAAANDARANALGTAPEGSAQPAAVASVPVACAGGGSAMLTITGGTPASVLNGQFDAGEVYQIVFAGCRGAFGAAAVSGSLGLTVVSASSTASASSLATEMLATDLVVALPRGNVTLNGSTSRQLASSTSGSTTQLSSRFATPGLTLKTQYHARTSSFTLSAVDVTRQSTWMGGVVQSSSINGTYTLAATLPNGAFSYTVSTQGGVNYSAGGVPTSGAWTISLPHSLVGVVVANGLATITVDDGKDGSIDRTFIVPVATLQTDAG